VQGNSLLNHSGNETEDMWKLIKLLHILFIFLKNKEGGNG
jgi:hypothetical protein